VTTASSSPSVVVIVLTWNGREDTLRCLESLQAVDYPNWEMLVVDNGSEDGTVDAVRTAYPGVTVIETGRNLGYTGGNNVGVEAALNRGAEFILILNNDTVVPSELLQAFVRAAGQYPDAGVFGAKIYFLHDPYRLWYGGASWSPRALLSFENLGGGVLDNGKDFEQVRDTPAVFGAAMFFRAAVVRTVGMLDDRFFLLYEEVDWCFRARRAGFRCLFVPEAKVWHRVSGAFGGSQSPLYEYFDVRNRLLWAEKNLSVRGRIRVWAYTMGLLCPLMPGIGGACGALWQLLRGRHGVKQAYWEIHARGREWWRERSKPGVRTLRKVQWRATGDYLIRRFGNCPASVRAEAGKIKNLET
jgi:GT2 family glycosyltransferase